MKIIEALKKIKDLKKKADDIESKVATHCADLDCETPTYPDQRRQVSEWVQSHGDIVKEIGSLRFRIQKTNVNTKVTIELGGKHVTKTITEWISRRKDLATLERSCWARLTDKGYKEQYSNRLTDKTEPTIVKKRLYFDPVERDRRLELYRSEPSIIDSTLEITNAVTDLME